MLPIPVSTVHALVVLFHLKKTRSMKYIFFFLSILIFSNCSVKSNLNSDSNLIGKWIVKEVDNEYFIEITKDNIFKMYNNIRGAGVELKMKRIAKNHIILNPLETEKKEEEDKGQTGIQILKEKNINSQEYKYQIKKNKLILINQKNNKKTIAENCNTVECD